MTKLICATLIAACCTLINASGATSIIPVPLKTTSADGQFQLTAASRIIADSSCQNEAQLLAARLQPSTGFALKIESADSQVSTGDIVLTTSGSDAGLGAEGYKLSVTPNSIVIRASTAAGVFYGSQSLLQLLPPEIFSTNHVTGTSWQIPSVTIEDQPRFAWRGFMLDVSRHFYTKAEVEKVLDLMALYKLNTFHWHLVDDGGWRIQIKKYPKLTSVGAWRDGIGWNLNPKYTTAYDKDGRYGGFYTQDDIRDVVAYAAARHITIVPEIEMPGHSGAALRSYPQFACSNSKDSNVYCAGNDATFEFLSNILSEVTELFPGKYIHIGGDEVEKYHWHHCPDCQARMKTENLKNEKELQAYFIRRIEKIVNADGKSLIGWSEIREGGLAPSAALMDWIGGGAESAASGHDVVMSPTKYCYFDHYQSTNHMDEPRAIGGYLPLQQVYQFDPMPEKLAPELQAHVLGGQANLWTEYIPNFRHVQYMMFPRLGALSEAVWSPKENRNWEDFKTRTAINEKRLSAMGINYRALSKPD